jgi:hypothetical protein
MDLWLDLAIVGFAHFWNRRVDDARRAPSISYDGTASKQYALRACVATSHPVSTNSRPSRAKRRARPPPTFPRPGTTIFIFKPLLQSTETQFIVIDNCPQLSG